jgi:two-component system, LytTR family, response regulator
MVQDLTAVIVDDEQHCIEALSGALRRDHPHVTLLGSASSVPAGVELVDRERPEILFLDVELGDRTGFDLLEAIGPHRPHVIFTTAHEGYAVKAIRFSALDYLLKPIDPDDLGTALGKARQALAAPQHPDQFMALMRNLMLAANSDRRIALPVAEGLEMVKTDDIIYCESASNYTVVHQRDGKRLVISRTLKEFEDLLAAQDFIRVHHAHLINVRHVRKYIRGEGGEVIMSDGANVAVSRRKKQELMDGLSRL